MLKLAHWSTTHRKYVVLGWTVLLLAVIALQAAAVVPPVATGSRAGGAAEGAEG